MGSMTKSQTHVGCLVAKTVLGAHSKSFQREVERFIRLSGYEWTTVRLKAIRMAAIHLRNKDLDSAIKLYQEQGIAYHKSDGTPRGPFRYVVRQFVSARRPSVVKRYDAVLRYYTTFVLPRPTASQMNKAVNSIQGEYKRDLVKDRSLLPYVARTMGCFQEFCRRLPETEEVPVVPLQALRAHTYTYSRRDLSHSDRKVPVRQIAWSLLHEAFVPRSLESKFIGDMLRPPVLTAFPDEGYSGKISIIQEQGAKARVVAMPSARIQYAFLPLDRVLTTLDQKVFHRTSCVRDQDKGVYGAVEFLEKHTTQDLYCTDLSSATDRFPRAVSMTILDSIGLQQYSIALTEVSARKWKSPMGDLHYSVGQPMGLYGSFILFHISNQMIAYAAEAAAIRDKGKDSILTFSNGHTFYVLGDDIIHSDATSALYYRTTMQHLGCDISPSKTLDGRIAEFAGFIIDGTDQSRNPFAYRPYKVPYEGDPITNGINFLDSLGSSVKKISKYWAKMIHRYALTRCDRGPSLSPLISKEKEVLRSPSWDSVVLDNEFTYLVGKYDIPVALNPLTSYAAGKFKSSHEDPGFTFVGCPPLVKTKVGIDSQSKISRDGPPDKTGRPNPSLTIKRDPLMRVLRNIDDEKRDLSPGQTVRSIPVKEKTAADEPDFLP